VVADEGAAVRDALTALDAAVALAGRVGTGKVVCVVSGGKFDFSRLAAILAGETRS
jgi:threonine dehydratase